MADPTLYLFDGHNLLHAGSYKDLRQLRDELASFVALKGARGFLVFDGSGADQSYGPLEVRYAKNADTMLERLAAEYGYRKLLPCLLRRRCAWDIRQGGAEAILCHLPRRPRGRHAQRKPAAPPARHARP